MQKVWFRQTQKNIYSTQSQVPIKTQATFIEEISKVLKVYRRKQEIYIKILEVIEKKNQNYDISTIKIQYQHTLNVQEQAFKEIQLYKSHIFNQSKTYLYTVFMRINQVLESTRQKIKKFESETLIKLIQHNRGRLQQCYQNQIYSQKIDIYALADCAKKLQNERLYRYLPKQKSIIHKPPPPIMQPQRVKSMQNQIIRLKSSINKLQCKNQRQNQIMNKKLMYSKQLPKIKRKQKNVFGQLYKLLGIKMIKIEQFKINRKQNEQQMYQRNLNIKQQRRQWQKQYRYYVKGFRTKLLLKQQNQIENKQ